MKRSFLPQIHLAHLCNCKRTRGEEFFERKSGATGHGHGKSSVWTVTVSWTIWVSELDFDFEEENMSVC